MENSREEKDRDGEAIHSMIQKCFCMEALTTARDCM